MSITSILAQLTDGEIYGDLERFAKLYGQEVAQKLSANIESFSFYDNTQSVLVYDGKQLVFDCNYTEHNHKKRLTSCYNKNGLFCDFSK